MKNLKNYMMILAGSLLIIAMTSCDHEDYYWSNHYWYDAYDNYSWRDRGDEGYNGNTNETLIAEAQTLRGHWQGTMIYDYVNEDGTRGKAQFLADMEFDQYDNSTNPLRGRGREIDTAGDEMQTLTFSWYVEDPTGNIYIRYDNTGKVFVLDAASRTNGFYLDSDYFNGCMIGVGASNDDIIDFDFTRYTYAREGQLQAPKKAKTSAKRKDAATNTHDIPWRLIKR